MTADRSQLLPAELVDRAGERLLAVSGAERAAALADLVAAHPEQADALRALCGDLDGVEHLLRSGYSETAAAVPEQLCGYRVVRRLGEGAFGIVYLCAQERPVVRDVAIKVLRPGAGDPKTLQRFAAERQVLAQLNHPGITQVFDAGELPDGRPFFVMEYVDGSPLHEWCVAQSVPCAARLRLFVDVCRAVAHAHARGIVHRDLKPANVLVVGTPDGPVPKVIDFGIAKALVGSDDGEPRTEAGRVVGTPGYMSPEQAAGRIDEVDPRADVFSLGVMLYELLTDQMPWARTTTASSIEPPRPSARVTTIDDRAAANATSRRKLAAELRGDLDWITLKAIARERDERYGSVAEFASDVERHLRGETVSAGPPSLRYRLRKLVRRHRGAVLAASAITIAAVGITFAVAHASRMESEADDARRDAATRLADSREFVARLLRRANDPVLFGAAHGDEMRRTLGTEALAFTDRLLADRSDDPALLHDRCDALHVVAEVYRLLGEAGRSRAIAAQAVAIGEQLHQREPDDLRHRGLLGSALRQEANAIAMAGDFDTARERFAAAVGHLEACVAAEPTRWRQSLAATLREMAAASPRQGDVAIALYERALASFDALRADPDATTATQADYVAALLGLGWQLYANQRFDEAWAQVERTAGELTSLGRERLRATSDFHRLRGSIARRRGELASTLADFEAAAKAAEEWCREQPRRIAAHRHLVAALDSLGNATSTFGDFDSSSAAHRRAIAAAEGMIVQFPEDRTARSSLSSRLCSFAHSLYDRFRWRDLAEAAALVDRAIELDDQLGDAALSGRKPRWFLHATRAAIAESRGDPGASEAWQRVDAMLPTDETAWQRETPGAWLGAMLGVARLHLGTGATAAAAQRAADARAFAARFPDQKKARVAISWIEARLAALAHDPAAAAAAADRILAERPTWFGSWRAGDCLCLAADCSDAATASKLRERAEVLYRRVVKTLDADVRQHPLDPWFVLPWGFAQLSLAGLLAVGGDEDPARELLAVALPRLEAVREDAHRDQWQADTFAAAVALRERLQR